MRERFGWSVVALVSACGFLVGIIVAVTLGTADPGAEERTVAAGPPRTVVRTVPTPEPERAPGRTVPEQPVQPAQPAAVPVPSVVGRALDDAKDELESAQFGVEVDGGGIFGVVVESNWTVVEQLPPAGSEVEPGATVTVRIERR